MVPTAPLDRPLTYDGKRYELIGGELFKSPSPSIFHQFAARNLFSLLRAFVLARHLGLVFAAPLDVRFDQCNTVPPAIGFLSREKRHLMRKGSFKLIDGAPDLLVEVLSPFNRGHDLIKKAAVSATFGVREYWLVDPEAETITVQVLRGGVYLPLVSENGIVRSEVLPGFEVNPRGLFALPDWMSEGADDAE